VRDVDVADDDELAFLPELLQVRVDLVEEAELGLLPFFVWTRIRWCWKSPSPWP